MRTILVVMCFVFASVANAYQVVETTQEDLGSLTKTNFVIDVDGNPLNQFTIHRLSSNCIDDGYKSSVLILNNPMQSDFDVWETNKEEYNESFAAFFPEVGVDIFGITDRLRNLKAGDCESGQYDCSVMNDWGLETLVDDISFMRSLIEDILPGRDVYMTGISQGAMSSIATVNRYPDQYKGIILNEGLLFADEATQQRMTPYCEMFEGMLAAGVYYDGMMAAGMKGASGLYLMDPEGQSPMIPGVTNQQAMTIAMIDPMPGPVSDFHDDYMMAYGDMTGLQYSNLDDIANMALRSNDYIGNRMIRDMVCSLSGQDDSFINNLDAFNGVVISLGGSHGFGKISAEQMTLFTNLSNKGYIIQNSGHLDSLYGDTQELYYLWFTYLTVTGVRW